MHTPTSVTPYHFARDYKNKLGWKKICRKCKGEDYLYDNSPNTTFGEDVDLRLNTKSENATTILLNDILEGKGLNIWEVESILGKYKKEDKEIKNIDLTAFSSAMGLRARLLGKVFAEVSSLATSSGNSKCAAPGRSS